MRFDSARPEGRCRKYEGTGSGEPEQARLRARIWGQRIIIITLREGGLVAIDLGSDVPAEALVAAADLYRPRFIWLSVAYGATTLYSLSRIVAPCRRPTRPRSQAT